MGNGWGYTAKGRLRKDDKWDWFCPTETKSRLEDVLFHSTRHEIRDIVDKEGANVIGFDGKNWVLGFHAVPSAVLDQNKFPHDKYGCDTAGRPLDWFHGFASESADFPERIPIVGRAHFKEMHETRIMPLWEQSMASSDGAWYGKDYKTMTSFETAIPTDSIASHLPQDAVDLLGQAHHQCKPIALHYNSETKRWSQIKRFEKDLGDRIKYEAERDKSLADREAKDYASATAQQGSLETTIKEAEADKGWVASFQKIHPAGKLAIIGGTVALGGLIGYGVRPSSCLSRGLVSWPARRNHPCCPMPVATR
jgi:hypothetical protein